MLECLNQHQEGQQLNNKQDKKYKKKKKQGRGQLFTKSSTDREGTRTRFKNLKTSSN
jgi:hypothetical protein